MQRDDHQPLESTEVESVRVSDIDRKWNRTGRNAAYVAGASFLIGTILFLLDAADLLGKGPQYHATAAGSLQDEATFWVAYFAHQHGILWDIIGRDLMLPLGFVALMVVGLAIRHLVGGDRPDSQLMVTFLIVGGVLSSVGDLLFLSDVWYWRSSGWSAHPPEIMVAIGRAAQAIETLNLWPEVAGFPILAVGLLYLGHLCRTRPNLPTPVGTVAYVEALLLVGIAIAEAAQSDTANQVLSLFTGVLVAPALGVWLGLHFGRLARR